MRLRLRLLYRFLRREVDPHLWMLLALATAAAVYWWLRALGWEG